MAPKTRTGRQQRPKSNHGVPDVYKVMLSDSRPDETRPLKKRKLEVPPASPPVQTVSDSSEDTDDSDVEWEEVEVGSGADYLLQSSQRAQEAEEQQCLWIYQT